MLLAITARLMPSAPAWASTLNVDTTLIEYTSYGVPADG